MKVKDCRKGEFITLKEIAEPKESQVYVVCGYDRSQRKYELQKFSDINSYKYIKGDTEVYTDFTF